MLSAMFQRVLSTSNMTKSGNTSFINNIINNNSLAAVTSSVVLDVHENIEDKEITKDNLPTSITVLINSSPNTTTTTTMEGLINDYQSTKYYILSKSTRNITNDNALFKTTTQIIQIESQGQSESELLPKVIQNKEHRSTNKSATLLFPSTENATSSVHFFGLNRYSGKSLDGNSTPEPRPLTTIAPKATQSTTRSVIGQITSSSMATTQWRQAGFIRPRQFRPSANRPVGDPQQLIKCSNPTFPIQVVVSADAQTSSIRERLRQQQNQLDLMRQRVAQRGQVKRRRGGKIRVDGRQEGKRVTGHVEPNRLNGKASVDSGDSHLSVTPCFDRSPWCSAWIQKDSKERKKDYKGQNQTFRSTP
uniref:Uncharacterized protein n=1 Tax=Heterorhabditis bacteriophora TaxID=37862 RepID=A0A1I7WT76_HETBA